MNLQDVCLDSSASPSRNYSSKSRYAQVEIHPNSPYPGPAGVGGPEAICIPVIWLVTCCIEGGGP